MRWTERLNSKRTVKHLWSGVLGSAQGRIHLRRFLRARTSETARSEGVSSPRTHLWNEAVSGIWGRGLNWSENRTRVRQAHGSGLPPQMFCPLGWGHSWDRTYLWARKISAMIAQQDYLRRGGREEAESKQKRTREEKGRGIKRKETRASSAWAPPHLEELNHSAGSVSLTTARVGPGDPKLRPLTYDHPQPQWLLLGQSTSSTRLGYLPAPSRLTDLSGSTVDSGEIPEANPVMMISC